MGENWGAAISKLGAEDRVMELVAKGQASPAIARIISFEFNTKISQQTVARFIKGVRQARQETTKSMVQQYAEGYIPRDFAILEDQVNTLEKLFIDKEDKYSIDQRIKIARELRETIELRIRACGIGIPGDKETKIQVVVDLL